MLLKFVNKRMVLTIKTRRCVARSGIECQILLGLKQAWKIAATILNYLSL